MPPSPPITGTPPTMPPARQLPLPLPMTADRPPPASTPAATPTPPRDVWGGLSPAAQQALRCTLLRVAREVRDVDHA